MPEEKQNYEKSATELLVDVLGLFSEHEGGKVIVVWTDLDGGVSIASNDRRVGALGLLEAGKIMVSCGPGRGD